MSHISTANQVFINNNLFRNNVFSKKESFTTGTFSGTHKFQATTRFPSKKLFRSISTVGTFGNVLCIFSPKKPKTFSLSQLQEVQVLLMHFYNKNLFLQTREPHQREHIFEARTFSRTVKIFMGGSFLRTQKL